MVSYVCGLLFSSCHWRMATITGLYVCIVTCIPQQASCDENGNSARSNRLANGLLIQIDENNTDSFLESFDNLKDPLEDGRKFLTSFLREINSRYDLNLTINEACLLIRKNIRSLDMSIEMEQVVLNTIALYETNNAPNFQHQKLQCSAMISIGVCPLWDLIALIKKIKFNSSPSLKLPVCEVDEIELPSDIYIGGVELLAGALCMIVGTAIPPFYAAGTILIGDGVNRVFNGVSQLGEERKNDLVDIKSH